MSDKRAVTPPQNGRLSRGPITQAGKDRSERNAITHGALAKITILDCEGRENSSTGSGPTPRASNPTTTLRMESLRNLVSTYWRARRLWSIESVMMNEEVNRQPHESPRARIAGAFRVLAETPKYNCSGVTRPTSATGPNAPSSPSSNGGRRSRYRSPRLTRREVRISKLPIQPGASQRALSVRDRPKMA
jgi:hypothetical protein